MNPIGLIIGLGILVLLVVWVSKDAKERGMEPAGWIVLVILLGLIGALIYLIARKPLVKKDNDSEMV